MALKVILVGKDVFGLLLTGFGKSFASYGAVMRS